MARGKRRGGRRGMLSKVGRKIASVGGSLLITAPVWEPAVEAYGKAGIGPDFMHQYLFSASGFNTANNQVDTLQVQNVIVRDAVFIGLGILFKQLAKRA